VAGRGGGGAADRAGDAGTRGAPTVARGRPPWQALPWALVTGFATAAGTGLLCFAAAAVTGVGFSVSNLVTCLRLPMWLLLVALVGTLPWLMIGAELAGRLRRRPTGAPVTAVGTAAVAGVLLLALFTGVLAPVTVARGDFDAGQAAAARARDGQRAAPRTVPPPPSRPGPGPEHGADPGRPLDRPTATKALDAVGALLPADRRTVEEKTGDEIEISPPECAELTARHARDERQLPRTADVARTYELDLNGAVGGLLTVHVGVVSYTTPVGDFAPKLDELARCPRTRIRTDFADSGWLDVTYTGRLETDLPYPRLSTRFDSIATTNGVPVEVDVFEDAMLVGHNRVTVRIHYAYAAIAPPADVQAGSVALGRAAALAVLDALRR
jgi:hypothetical protein